MNFYNDDDPRAWRDHQGRRETKTHELKTWPPHFEAIRSGAKKCEVRVNDRGFATGDLLILREWIPATGTYTGHKLRMRVTHVLPGGQFGLAPGHVCMSLDWAGDDEEAAEMRRKLDCLARRNLMRETAKAAP
jgi:hypothetical protein